MPHSDKQEGPSLHFVVVSLNMKSIADSVKAGGCKWLERIHISEHIWLTNQNAKSYKQTWKKKVERKSQWMLMDEYLVT